MCIRKLNLQIIMVRHINELKESADRIIKVWLKKGKSAATQYDTGHEGESE